MAYWLTNLLYFDILLLYYYTNLNSSIICCCFFFFGDMFLCFSNFGSLFCNSLKCSTECDSLEDFFEIFLIFEQFCYQLNHQLLLLFFELLVLKQFFIASAVDFLALSRSFSPYLLVKFLPMFLAKDKKIHILLHMVYL